MDSPLRVIWVGLSIVLAVSLLLTFTRSVWLALVVSLGYLIWHWNRKLLLAAPALLAVLVVITPEAAQRRIQSIADPGAKSARLIMWKTGWQMVQAHPWLGVGPMRVGARFGEFVPEGTGELPDAYYEHLHNVFIHYAAERGIPAALMILWLLAKVIRDHRKALAQLPPCRGDRRFILQATIAATIGVMIMGCFDLTLGDSEILAVYLAIVALGYRAVQGAPATSPQREIQSPERKVTGPSGALFDLVSKVWGHFLGSAKMSSANQQRSAPNSNLRRAISEATADAERK